MRRAATPPPPLHQLSAAVSTATTATNTSPAMSSRSPYRGGGRYGRHRGFSSERPYSGGRGQFVSDDSHFQSVQESNLGFRQGERGGYGNNAGSYTAPRNPRPPSFGGNHQFRQAPPSTQRHQYRGPHPHTHYQQPPSFNQNQGVRMPQQFRPRPPKPLDFRHWDYAKTQPPSTCVRCLLELSSNRKEGEMETRTGGVLDTSHTSSSLNLLRVMDTFGSLQVFGCIFRTLDNGWFRKVFRGWDVIGHPPDLVKRNYGSVKKEKEMALSGTLQ
ncbi:carbon catabolite repressor protein 4-like protein 6 isoform X2 [Cucumis melo var. makuwa]|uniref:Carbon catabolite repressor protein 4-like protein 6 isoform X2 n=1 Tax=Cucumis melo var. makuwa TaxID=1194695 RepID=A0A5D3E6E7_CUCMM|nr:carbon catabolite repressor protein 4-like protein 6 isoform X2 [Cucumis melo var. makuwa]